MNSNNQTKEISKKSSKKPVIIIGAGVGGLSTAILLVNDGFSVSVYEKSDRVGGRTASTEFRNHILDNGFHIMPFYKKSAIYEILKDIKIESRLKLAIVDKIAFYDNGFHTYPKGICDILKMSLIPFKSRISLLKILLPMAFTSMEKAEQLDSVPLTQVTSKLDFHSKQFFNAVCMLAFADSPEHISLGEFARTIIRANPFKGGTSEFAYPDMGGYDRISEVMANYVKENHSQVNLSHSIKKVIIHDKKVTGIELSDGKTVETDCVIISYPAYHAINQLFESGEKIYKKLSPWPQDRLDPPHTNHLRINFLAEQGLYFGQGPISMLLNDTLARPTLITATNLMRYLVDTPLNQTR